MKNEKTPLVHCSGGISDNLQDKRKKFQNKRKNQITESSELKKFPCKKFRKVSSGIQDQVFNYIKKLTSTLMTAGIVQKVYINWLFLIFLHFIIRALAHMETNAATPMTPCQQMRTKWNNFFFPFKSFFIFYKLTGTITLLYFEWG